MKMDTVAQKLTIPLSLSLSIVYKISRLINFDDTHFHRYFNRLLIAHASGEIVSMRHDRQTRKTICNGTAIVSRWYETGKSGTIRGPSRSPRASISLLLNYLIYI